MPTRKSWRKRIIKKLLLHPGTLLPLGGGLFLLLATGGAGILAAIGGLVGLGGLAHFAFRTIFADAAKIGKEALEEIQREAEIQLEAKLDTLYKRLLHDRDPRTQNLLTQLRALMRDLRQPHMWQSVDSTSARELMDAIDKLFHDSIQKLEQQLEIFDSMANLSSDASRNAMSERREVLIREVEQNVRGLNDLIASIAQLKPVTHGSHAGQLREQIRTGLEIARAVNDRLAAEAHESHLDLSVPAEISEAPPAHDAPSKNGNMVPE